MGVQTIGEAYQAGWRIHVRCAWGRREAMKSVRACLGRAELDLHTLIWTRGSAFPLTNLESRLKAIGFEAPPKLSRGNYLSLAYLQVPAFLQAVRGQEGISARALAGC